MASDHDREVTAYYEAWKKGMELMDSILAPLSQQVQDDTIFLLEDYEEEMAEEFIRTNEEAFIKFVVGYATEHPVKYEDGV